MKKLVIVSLSAGILILGAVIVNAQTTFQGPPSGCTSPTQTGCNLDGVIWNRAITAPQAQNASFYISGNTRTGGSARVGSGLTVDSGGANITGTAFISGNTRITNGLQIDANGANITGNTNVTGNVNTTNDVNATGYSRAGVNMIEMWPSGDLLMRTTKAIRVDNSSGASTFNIGNWGAANLPVNVNILGTLNVTGNGTWNQAKITSREYCIGTSCITAWPTGGGGGSVTSVGSGNGLTGGPITSSGTLNVGAGTGISVGTDDVGLDLSYTDGRYFVRDNQLDNNAGIYSRSGRIGAMDNSGSNSNYPYVNIGGGYIGYYENLGYWSVSPSVLFRNSVSMLGGTVSIGQSAGHTLQIVGIVNGNTRYSVGGNYSSFCISSGGTTCSSWTPTLGAVRGDQLCIGTDCRNAWPSAGGTGDVTDVLGTAPITITNSGGPQPTVSLASCANGQVYKWNGTAWACANDVTGTGDITDVLATANGGVTITNSGGPQPSVGLLTTCASGQVLKWNGTAWACAADANSGDITGVTAGARLSGGGTVGDVTLSLQTCPNYNDMLRMNSTGQWECLSYIPGTGDITGVTAGNGLMGGGTSGDVALSVRQGTGINVYGTGVYLDTTYTNGLYVNSSGNDTMTGYLNLQSAGVGTGAVALQVAGSEAIWYNGTRYSWGYGGTENYFADQVYINNNTDTSLTSDGAITLGNKAGTSMSLDGNEIQARSGTSASTLHLNYDGGNIITGNGMIMLASCYDCGGKIGMGVDPTSLAYKLNLPSDGGVTSRGTARATAWHTHSDGRIKLNQKTIDYGLDELLKLKPKKYEQHGSDFVDDNLILSDDYKIQIGFIAQEVYPLIPEAVFKPENEQNDLWSLDYEKIIPITVKAIQEQQEMIDSLKSQNDQLREQNQDLEQRLQRLEALMSTILR